MRHKIKKGPQEAPMEIKKPIDLSDVVSQLSKFIQLAFKEELGL